jgi:hypothetical protein
MLFSRQHGPHLRAFQQFCPLRWVFRALRTHLTAMIAQVFFIDYLGGPCFTGPSSFLMNLGLLLRSTRFLLFRIGLR